MNNILRNILIVCLGSLLLMSCASTTDPADAYKGEGPEQIYQKGVAALRNNNFQEATKRFEALNVQYPFSPHIEKSQLYLIYAYYMKEDYALAVVAANQYIRLHPTSDNISYAYYLRGISDYYQNMGALERIFAIDLATRDLTQIRKSFDDFRQITTLHPNSRFAPAAHQYQIYLRNVLANHELHVAEYYYNKKAYVAANNRASKVVTNYQGAPAVVDALILMVKASHELGLVKEEQDALAVLHYNYPYIKVNYRSGYDM